eukprot:Phypoly_transcript_11152.p1 GENE.Phypoly_transcript_11152~~Phypoly_transcript_11152.p1  ORF type:complete len:398 (+),score=40.12 Phypoly_transcript_11152:45-1196(+)
MDRMVLAQIVLVLALVSGVLGGAMMPATLNLVWVPNAVEQNIVCNDGSPYGYYFRKNNPDKWIVHFQGGGWCYDEPTCSQRNSTSNRMMSSKTWTNVWYPSGIFDQNTTNNPDWYDATYVYLPYCTSDSFSGNVTASAKTFGWSFLGKVVLQGVIQTLLPQGLSTATSVLVSGCSAGGAAVVANVDYVNSLLPPNANRVLKGHVDAGWFMFATPFSSVPITMQGILETGAKLWGGLPNPACAAAYPENPGMCYMGEFALPYFKVPVLVHQESEDFPQLLINGLQLPWTSAGVAYEDQWRANLTSSLKKLQPPHAAFSPACYWHCVTEDDTFWQVSITQQNINDRDALHAFFFGNQPNIWIDGCSGFSCSNGCPPTPSLSKDLF